MPEARKIRLFSAAVILPAPGWSRGNQCRGRVRLLLTQFFMSMATRCIGMDLFGRYLYYANNTGITNQYSFQNQEPLFRHNCTLLSYAIKSNYSESVIHIWTTCLNLLIDLKRCSNTDDRYLAAATSFISANRPKLHYLTKTKLTAKERLKFICATIIGTGLFTNILSKNRRL